jgi:hypothetical protein
MQIYDMAKAAVFSGAIICLTCCAAAAQSGTMKDDATRPAQIEKADLLILIRQTLSALDLSNKSGNYSILREISAPGFAATNDAARLSMTFKRQRERGVDYSGTLVYEPQITRGPEISKDGMLMFQGYFPSASSQIKFEMIFAPVDGRWKLFGLAADLAPTGPIAPLAIPQSSNDGAQPGPAKNRNQPASIIQKK